MRHPATRYTQALLNATAFGLKRACERAVQGLSSLGNESAAGGLVPGSGIAAHSAAGAGAHRDVRRIFNGVLMRNNCALMYNK